MTTLKKYTTSGTVYREGQDASGINGPYYLAADIEPVLADLIQSRDGWHADASSHLQALCEKQAEVNGLQQQLAQALLDVQSNIVTIEQLRQQLATARAEVWEEAALIADHMPCMGNEQKRLMGTMSQVCRMKKAQP